MSDQDPLTGRPVTPPEVPVPPTTGAPPIDTPVTAVPTTPPSMPTAGTVGTTGTTGGQGGETSTTDQAKIKAEQAKDVAREKADEAREKASAAGQAVGQHAGQVTESAKAHAGEVAGEARRQAVNLAEQGVEQLRQQASTQVDKAAELLQGVSSQLQAMASGEKPPEGPIADLVQEGAQRIDDLASRLRTGGWEMALRDVQRFARRRPGVFLASAFGVGVLAGRAVRGASSAMSGSEGGGTGYSGGYGADYGMGSGADIELSRTTTPAPVTTGTIDTTLPGAPTYAGADPLRAGDPTGVQGGLR